uniref:Cadherin-related tumor suppressor-like n=1 Tax=Saccoglossus kowalevskii TaxID=10224 RepID=A0ABM0MH69_SACKO|nr:PREDICTED: cadherin-related tumor suppressor-like [Saccoglossus kowalevskii]
MVTTEPSVTTEPKLTTELSVTTEPRTTTESMPDGTYVANAATDAYESYNIQYAFVESNVTDFTIDSNTGIVTTAKPLDREDRSSYRYSIMVYVEDGSICLVDPIVAELKVTILDENDNSPYFLSDYYEGQVHEINQFDETPQGNEEVELTPSIMSTDWDYGFNASTIYTLAGDGHEQFKIDEKTGVITTTDDESILDLDREERDRYDLEVIVFDRDGVDDLSLNTSVPLTIVLRDVNDNYPQFTKDEYNYTIWENSPTGYEIDVINATDEDIGNNATISFVIHTGADGHFEINRNTGVLSVANTLDRETKARYTFNISASDHGVPILTNYTEVIIDLLDINDNQPTFTQSAYRSQQEESVPIGTSVLQVTAVDSDAGLNGQVIYSSNTTDFTVDNITGEVMTLVALDYEDTDGREYIFDVFAEDCGEPSHTGSSQVTITVTDINDNAPQFASTYECTIDETMIVGDIVVIVEATDADSDTNGEVTYFIDNNDFSIDDSGVITLAKDAMFIICENGDYCAEINVTARDGGEPSLYSSTDVFVSMTEGGRGLEFNQKEYRGNVSEEQEPPIYVLTVSVSNDDTVDYRITSHVNEFVINPTTGEIFTAMKLDREEEARYSFSVAATDPDGDYYEGYTLVNILVDNINDNSPIFDRPYYSGEVDEGNYTTCHVAIVTVIAFDADTGHNTEITYSITDGHNAQDGGSPSLRNDTRVYIQVIDVNDNEPTFIGEPYDAEIPGDEDVNTTVITVVATDDDSGENGRITYTMKGFFEIDEITGEIQTNGTIDREVEAIVYLVVLANDCGVPSKQDNATVDITLLDVNDNPPTIDPDEMFSFVYHDSPIGTFVVDVNATDPDVIGMITYSLSPTKESVRVLFEIDEQSGVITTSATFTIDVADTEYEIKSNYTLRVSAQDGGTPSLRNDTRVYIQVIYVNDNEPTFIGEPYDAEVPGDEDVNTTVITVVATDDDSGENGRITYTMKGFFEINNITGVIQTNGTIDREVEAIVYLVVSANDCGVPSKHDNATVDITLLDVNDNPPTIDPDDMFTFVYHDSPIGTFVVDVNATDPDVIGNITYSLSLTKESVRVLFEIDEQSGNPFYDFAVQVGKDIEKDELENMKVLSRTYVEKGPIEKLSATKLIVYLMECGLIKPESNDFHKLQDILRKADRTDLADKLPSIWNSLMERISTVPADTKVNQSLEVNGCDTVSEVTGKITGNKENNTNTGQDEDNTV